MACMFDILYDTGDNHISPLYSLSCLKGAPPHLQPLGQGGLNSDHTAPSHWLTSGGAQEGQHKFSHPLVFMGRTQHTVTQAHTQNRKEEKHVCMCVCVTPSRSIYPSIFLIYLSSYHFGIKHVWSEVYFFMTLGYNTQFFKLAYCVWLLERGSYCVFIFIQNHNKEFIAAA